MKKEKRLNLFTTITIFLVVILPFYVIIKLFLEKTFGFEYFGFFFKELMVVLLFFSLVFSYFKDKKVPKFGILDYLFLAFVLYGIFITFFNGLSIKSLIFGGRYDFTFLFVMLVFKHSSSYLKIKLDRLLSIFLISGGVALFLGLIFKFSLGEEYLKLFGFVDYVGNRVYSGGVANFQGLEGTGIRRFQGIFDGPNPMAYFLIFYTFSFLYLQKNKREFYVFVTIIFLFWLLIITYSRSALLGFLSAILSIFLFDLKILKELKNIFLKHKKIFIPLTLIFLIFVCLFSYTFRYTIKDIFVRNGSTSGHFERMEVGIKRFIKKPLGSGLAEAGPAFRNVYKDKQTKENEVYYIPESRYIQILIEGGIVYFMIFIVILLLILKGLLKKSSILFGMFLGILVMNLFLHIFESSYFSILFFIFIGLFLKREGKSSL